MSSADGLGGGGALGVPAKNLDLVRKIEQLAAAKGSTLTRYNNVFRIFSRMPPDMAARPLSFPISAKAALTVLVCGGDGRRFVQLYQQACAKLPKSVRERIEAHWTFGHSALALDHVLSGKLDSRRMDVGGVACSDRLHG